jgi:hypothetical protein
VWGARKRYAGKKWWGPPACAQVAADRTQICSPHRPSRCCYVRTYCTLSLTPCAPRSVLASPMRGVAGHADAVRRRSVGSPPLRSLSILNRRHQPATLRRLPGAAALVISALSGRLDCSNPLPCPHPPLSAALSAPTRRGKICTAEQNVRRRHGRDETNWSKTAPARGTSRSKHSLHRLAI